MRFLSLMINSIFIVIGIFFLAIVFGDFGLQTVLNFLLALAVLYGLFRLKNFYLGKKFVRMQYIKRAKKSQQSHSILKGLSITGFIAGAALFILGGTNYVLSGIGFYLSLFSIVLGIFLAKRWR
ncbi:hypothetical protein [Neobacillus vireti]|uniref:hypothetical protein n=1 Tax=Neobacillus vireti TaxID=220686 RepID=UPI002FFE0BFC